MNNKLSTLASDQDLGDWRNYAACKDEDPELFFPPAGDSMPARLHTEEAKAVCNRCAVSVECAAFVLQNNVEYGVWGGLSETDRKQIKRRQWRNENRRAS